MNDIIRLALLVGRQECPNTGCDNTGCMAVQTSYDEWEPQQCEWCECHPESAFSFDPFTDANDDYAVLEWMRNNVDAREWTHVLSDDFRGGMMCNYQIGDYARAALKVIKKEQDASSDLPLKNNVA